MSEPPTESGDAASHLQLTGQRLAEVIDAARREDVPAERARQVLHEMATALEELRVAEEELVVQSEQLLASAAAVDAERERYGELFEFAPDAYLETDGYGKILLANSAAARLLGVTGRLLTGKLIQTFLGGADRRAMRRLLSDLQDGVQPLTRELTIQPRGGEPVPVEVRAARHVDLVAGSGELRIRWLARDVSERQQLQREVAELHADVDLLASLADVNRLVSDAPDPMVPMLEGLVELASRVTEDAEAGAQLTDRHGKVALRAMSSLAASTLCVLQDESGGPAMETMADGRPRRLTVEQLTPWPALAAAMRRSGFAWVFTQPIATGGPERAVFNLYGRGEPPDLERALHVLADHAAGIIANGAVYRSAADLARNLAIALETRGVIDQAKGVIMAWRRCDADTAFAELKRRSQHENVKLHLVAEDVLRRAERGEGAGGSPATDR